MMPGKKIPLRTFALTLTFLVIASLTAQCIHLSLTEWLLPTAAALGNARKAVEKAEREKDQSAEASQINVVPPAIKPSGDYERDRWHPIHFKPLIDTASNEQCLSCHQDILSRKPLEKSPVGIEVTSSLAWYQTLDTYEGEQMTFHARHLTGNFSKLVMDLKCSFCHRGYDPRDEAPGSHKENEDDTAHTLRKVVDPSDTCLRCHGRFPYERMTGVGVPWPQARQVLEKQGDPVQHNGCLGCHKDTYRTVRHQVTYLKPENIEKLAAEGSSDVCYGCHGGRQWYRISYPYPRHPWPGMSDAVDKTPDWAVNRPTESDPRYRKVQE